MLDRPLRRRSYTAFGLLAVFGVTGAFLALGSHRAVAHEAPVVAAAPAVAAVRAAGPVLFGLPGRTISPGDLAKSHASFDTTANCEKCHPGGKGKTSTPASLCASADCHGPDIGKNQKEKTGLHGSPAFLSKDCGACHYDHAGLDFDMIDGLHPKAKIAGVTTKANAWGVAMNRADGSQKNFDHDLTGYKLIGGHKIDCDKCHKPAAKRPKSTRRTFLGTDQECLSCHDNYHKFKPGNAFEECLLCHTFFNWNKTFNLQGFDHDTTRFPLRLAHQKVQCAQCHPKGKPFGPLAFETCESCHTKDSPHEKAFTTKPCITCHSEASWKKEKVTTAEHKVFAKYDAVGAHAKLACAVCHKGLKMSPTTGADGDCLACHNNIHQDRWVKGKPCLKCHDQNRWVPLTVENKDHRTWSTFDLTGRHLQLECFRCHRDLIEIPQRKDCGYCHVDAHKGTRGKTCDSSNCHTTAGWDRSTFNHDDTRFPLTGKHTTVRCEQCHKVPGKWKHDTTCGSCHGSPHLGKLPNACDNCHKTAAWEDEVFNHNEQSDFKLAGKHGQVDCYHCHLDMGFKGTPQTCIECHWDYHRGAWGVGNDCSNCHNERRWAVERNTLIFQTLHNYGEVVLAGAHESLTCETCHTPQPRWLMNGFGGECNVCHADPHLGGRGHECHDCHSQTTWLPAIFNHITTGYPLIGSHRLVSCIECHKGNLYSGTPDDCIFCHADDLQQSPAGTHRLIRSIDCGTCHVPTRWDQHSSG